MARYLALDWDQNQLSVVSVNVRGRTVRIEKAASWTEDASPNPLTAADLGKTLRERLKEAGMAAAPLLVCLARDRVRLKEIRFPIVPDGEEPDLVRFQAVKDLSDSPEDVVIDYMRFPTPPGATERRALVMIAAKELVTAYQTLAAAAGLKLLVLSPRPFGLVSGVRHLIDVGLLPPPEAEAGREPTFAVVAVADKWAEFAVVRGRTLLLTRSLNVGPMLAGEVRRNLTVYAGGNAQDPVKAVYVAANEGGDLRQRLGDLLTVPVHPFTPFAGSEALSLSAAVNGGQFAPAIGLCQAYAARAVPIDFINPTKARPPADNRRALVMAGALLLLVIVVGLFVVVPNYLIAGMTANANDAEQQRDALKKQVEVAQADNRYYAGLEAWDSLRIPDELYDLTHRVPDVNALKITEFRVDQVRELKFESKTKSTDKDKDKAKTNDVVARLTIKGTLVDSKARTVLDGLIDEFQHDGYYTLALPPKLEGNVFTLVLNVKRHSPYKRPEEERRVLAAPTRQPVVSGEGD